jgi:HD-like signal output (HDOD) protein
MGREAADHAAIAAMLHDVGKLVLDTQCADECLRIYDVVRAQNRRVAEVEAEQLGLTHAEVGAYLLGLWGLPQPVVQAVARHHDAAPATGGQNVADVVHFANLLDHDIFIFNEHYARAEASEARLASIGGRARYEAWKAETLRMGLEEQQANAKEDK